MRNFRKKSPISAWDSKCRTSGRAREKLVDSGATHLPGHDRLKHDHEQNGKEKRRSPASQLPRGEERRPPLSNQRKLERDTETAADAVEIVIGASKHAIVEGEDTKGGTELNSHACAKERAITSNRRAVRPEQRCSRQKAGKDRIFLIAKLVQPGTAHFGPQQDTVVYLDIE